MTVYVTHSVPGRTMDAARAFGKLVVVFPNALFPGTDQVVMARLAANAAHKLQNFSVTRDYLLFSGAPESIAWCSAYLCVRYGHFTALKWDREGSFYYPIEISTERIQYDGKEANTGNTGVNPRRAGNSVEGRHPAHTGAAEGRR